MYNKAGGWEIDLNRVKKVVEDWCEERGGLGVRTARQDRPGGYLRGVHTFVKRDKECRSMR